MPKGSYTKPPKTKTTGNFFKSISQSDLNKIADKQYQQHTARQTTKPPASKQRGGMAGLQGKYAQQPFHPEAKRLMSPPKNSGKKTPRVTLRNLGYGGTMGGGSGAGQSSMYRKKF